MTSPIVLVVDDDPAIRDSVSLLLETAGFTAKCHGSAGAWGRSSFTAPASS